MKRNEGQSRRERDSLPGACGADGARDGDAPARRANLVTLYARRADRCQVDLRPVVEQRRHRDLTHASALRGAIRGIARGTHLHRVGRGTEEHAAATGTPLPPVAPAWRTTLRNAGDAIARGLSGRHRVRQLVAMSGLAGILLVSGMGGALAQERYRVQPGDSIDSIAATFGVDPQAILAASWVPDPQNLDVGQVLVIPDPGQSPSEAAQYAAAHEGQSPWVSGLYVVQSGDTIEDIAAKFGVTPHEIATLNGLSNPDMLDIGQKLLIPPADDGSDNSGALTEASMLVAHGGKQVSGVPFYLQEHNLSCEYAAAHIATAAFGNPIPEQSFIDNIPEALNPHDGYRGNIDGWWGNITDYGVYPEAMQSVIKAWGFNADIFYSEGASSQLTAEIDAGHPVLVWVGLWGDTAQKLHDDGTYTVAAGDHVLVVYGYDNEGVYVSDPAKAAPSFYDWTTFTQMWQVLDGMSMAIYPAS